MGVFPFIILLVLITTIGKVLSDRQSTGEFRGELPKIGPGEIDSLRATMEELSGRVVRLEEERDFYKNLLESPRRAELSPPPTQADPSDLPPA